MIPSAFVWLDSFPMAAGGKLDRDRLPAPEAFEAPAVGGPPAEGTEAALAAIWAEALGVEGIGRGDDFFALGGHSILATRVMARVRGRFGVELPLRSFFEAPTLAELARIIDARAGAAPEPERIGRAARVKRRLGQPPEGG